MAAYHRPVSLQDALALRAAGPVLPLAGGTDVYPAKATREAWGDRRQADVLDLSRLAELRGLEPQGDRLRIGALVTWTELRRAALPAAFDGLKAAAREVGGPQVQNRGTLVGNLCNASPAADGIPCLLTLDAEVELASLQGRRVLPLAAFVDGYRRTLCRPDELVTAILVPPQPTGAEGRFLKLGARRYLVISIVMVAALLALDEAGLVAEARLAVGACSAVAQRLSALEGALRGRPLAEAAGLVAPEHLGGLAPLDDVRGSAAFRGAAALDLLRDILAAAPRRRAA